MSQRANEARKTACGLAALAVCESLLLALTDMKVLTVGEANGVLTDAAATMRTGGDDLDRGVREAASDIIEKMLFERAVFRNASD